MSVVLVALLFPAAAAAQGTVVIGAQPFLVGGGAGHQTDAHISGSLVAWTSVTETSMRVYYLDLSVPGAVPLVIPAETYDRDSIPAVFGSTIVFRRASDLVYANGGGEQTMAFDVRTPSVPPVVVAPSFTGARYMAAIGADTVAMAQSEAGFMQTDVCVATLRDPSAPEHCLTSDHLFNSSPSVSPDGNTVVWSKSATQTLGNSDLFIAQRNAATGAWGEPRLLVDTGFTDRFADTDGQMVTWVVTTDTGNHVYFMSLDGTIPPQPITFADGADSRENAARVSGNLISFTRATTAAAPPDVWLYDFSTDTRYLVSETPGFDVLSDLSVDGTSGTIRVVWTDHDTTSWDPGDDVLGAMFSLAARALTIQPLFNQGRAYKLGSVVPIRLQLLDADGLNVSSPSRPLTATALLQTDGVADPVLVEDAGNANADSAFRYDEALAGYIFNLSTKNLAPGTWELRFTAAGDPREYRVAFDVK